MKDDGKQMFVLKTVKVDNIFGCIFEKTDNVSAEDLTIKGVFFVEDGVND